MLNGIVFLMVLGTVVAVVRYAPTVYGFLECLIVDALGFERDSTPGGW